MPLTPEQIEIRSRGIGGSEIAAVAGLSPYAGPFEVFLSKTGRLPEKQSNSNLQRGTHLGPALARWYSEKTGQEVTHTGQREETLQHSKHPIVIATPDGRIRQGRKVIAPLEVKSPRWTTAGQWGEAWSGDVPDLYVPQTTWEASVILDRWPGEAEAWTGMGALIHGDLVPYRVDFDPDLFAALVDIANKFWRDHVETDTPPQPDATETVKAWLQKEHPKATADIIEATVEIEDLLRAYSAASEDEKNAKHAKLWARNRVVGWIKEHQGASGRAFKCTHKDTKPRKQVDWEALARVEFLDGLSPKQAKEITAKHTTTVGGERKFLVTKIKG